MSTSNARLSFLITDSGDDSSYQCQPRAPSPFRGPTKYFERRLIRAWKTFTRATRKNPRNSVLPDGFVLMTNRRKSVMYGRPSSKIY